MRETRSPVVLTTELESNVALYEHLGYEVRGRADIDELISWTMYRADPP